MCFKLTALWPEPSFHRKGAGTLKKSIVRLSEAERKTCQKVIRKLKGSSKGSSQDTRRARILLKVDADGPDWCDHQVAEAFDCRERTVANAACWKASSWLSTGGNGTRPLQNDGMAGRYRQYGGIPQKVDREYVAAMDDILSTYEKPYDERPPVVCMDELPVRMVRETRQPLPATTEHPRRVDSEWERAGIASVFGVL